MIRLLLAEDHALVRDGLRLLISAQPDMTLLADTGDGETVVPLVCKYRPDVLLLDLGLPKLDGLAIMSALASENMPTRTLIVTARLDAVSVRTSLALGAAGYLPKSEDSDVLLTAIREVAADRNYISPEIAHLSAPEQEIPGTDVLTLREREVLGHVGQGLSCKEIARHLGISDLTVRKHRENLCRKLQVRNTAELVAVAIRTGIAP